MTVLADLAYSGEDLAGAAIWWRNLREPALPDGGLHQAGRDDLQPGEESRVVGKAVVVHLRGTVGTEPAVRGLTVAAATPNAAGPAVPSDGVARR